MSLPLTRRQILSLAWPIVLANSAIPLLGIVDTVVIGNTGSVADLGAIGLGALIFSFVFWGFGFLRMGTTGFTAQASGRGDSAEVRATLARALILAFTLGIALMILQLPISSVALSLIGATPEVEALTKSYFNIRIWAAPASLGVFAVLGSLIGLGQTRQVLIVQLFMNGLNIGLDLLFAGLLDWGVEGVALGTALAEWITLGVSLVLLARVLRDDRRDAEDWWPLHRIWDRHKARAMLGANTDIMVRTLFLLFGFGWFINQGAVFGDEVLAANHLLLQMVAMSAYLLDGFAHATEILVGRAVGVGNLKAFDQAVRRSTELAGLSALVLAGCVAFLGPFAIELFTEHDNVRRVATSFIPFTAVYVVLSFAAFQLDGVFIGATGTREMRNASVLSCIGFILVSLALVPTTGNAGLWISFVVFVVLRAAILGASLPSLRARLSV
jgi:MATE family multidrug resistance protein